MAWPNQSRANQIWPNQGLRVPIPPFSGAAIAPIPFTIRTTAMAAVFSCLFIASVLGAQTLTLNPTTIGMLQLVYAQLLIQKFLLGNQATMNNRADLYAQVTAAITTVTNLQAILAGMTVSGAQVLALQNFRSVVGNALTTLLNVQTNENQPGDE